MDLNAEMDAVDMRRIFVRFATAVAMAAVAIAAGALSAGPAIKVDRLAFTLDPCPLVATAGGLLFDAALIAPRRPDSGFTCPINRMPTLASAHHSAPLSA
jgi:hypothetical protein